MPDGGQPVLGALLGEGATAHVFAAVDSAGRDVVVKVMKPALARDPAVRVRFLREARAASQVAHPRLVPILGCGSNDAGAWLVMPRLGGGTLAEALEAGPLTLAAGVRLSEDMAGGLDALHAGGVVHRDLKPSNVLFDGTGVAHLADFGLAKDVDWTALTGNETVLGTPHYLAPEVIAGEPASPSSDRYALGCLLWEALSGAPPFAGRSLFDIGAAHLHESPSDPGLPRAVTFALRAALEKEPGRRPHTAHALAAMLRVAAFSSASPA